MNKDYLQILDIYKEFTYTYEDIFILTHDEIDFFKEILGDLLKKMEFMEINDYFCKKIFKEFKDDIKYLYNYMSLENLDAADLDTDLSKKNIKFWTLIRCLDFYFKFQ